MTDTRSTPLGSAADGGVSDEYVNSICKRYVFHHLSRHDSHDNLAALIREVWDTASATRSESERFPYEVREVGIERQPKGHRVIIGFAYPQSAEQFYKIVHARFMEYAAPEKLK